MDDSESKLLNRISTFLKNGITITFTFSYKVVLFLGLAIYLAWELYWAWKVGYACIKWHTHLMIYVYLWVIGYFFLNRIYRHTKPKRYENAVLFISVVSFTFLLLEILFMVLKTNQTTIESFGYGYYSWHDSRNESYYRTRSPHNEYWLSKSEYRYQRFSNAYGFADNEWEQNKGANEKRILCLGDSYTEGDGAPFDSSYVSLLRKKFISKDTNFTFMNAGTCGNDPFVNFVNYRDRLIKLKPDIILQTLSSGDLTVDIMVRGGMERFQNDGKVKYRPAPWWEPIYAISYLSRLYFSSLDYNELLIKKSDIENQKKEIDERVITLYQKYAALAKANECILIVVLHPYRDEVIANKYQYNFTYIESELKKTDNLQILDLLPEYLSKTKGGEEPIDAYYWPKDGHHNSKGYKMMAEVIYNKIEILLMHYR